jgi:hypothetical protein
LVIELFRTSDWYCGSVDNLFVSIQYGPPSLEHLTDAERFQSELIARYPNGIAVIALVPNLLDATNLDPQIRKRVTEMSQKHSDAIRAMAIVVERKGLLLTITRAMMAAISLVTRAKMKVFGDLDEALQFLADHGPSDGGWRSDRVALRASLVAARDAGMKHERNELSV